MALHVKNTLTNRLEPFEPLVPGKVGMYVCGPTVYSFFHVGNARPFVVFDVVRRWLEYSGYDVTFVQNITDVDDKLINQAREEGVDVSVIAGKYTDAFLEDTATLGVKPATHQPRATQSMDWIIDMIKSLEERGYTYTVDGDVFYRIKAFDEYGKLSGKRLDDLRIGASGRTDAKVDDRKEHPYDFALWKAQKTEDEPAWDSPWGPGRPGWHIECSAMSSNLLGATFDIHAGGEDLVFPHHENEIAQAEGAHDHAQFVRYWLHNGFINMAADTATKLSDEDTALLAEKGAFAQAVEAGDWAKVDAWMEELAERNVHLQVDRDNRAWSMKMGKSAGNVIRARDVFAKGYTGQVLRFFLLRAHYRGPLTFSWSLLDDAKTALNRWRAFRGRLQEAQERLGNEEAAADTHPLTAQLQALRERFVAEMDNDFNTPGAIGVAFEVMSLLNPAIDGKAEAPVTAGLLADASALLADIEGVLGLDMSPDTAADALTEEEQALLDARVTARKEKQWAESDRLRDELKAHGIQVEDTPQGQRWLRMS